MAEQRIDDLYDIQKISRQQQAVESIITATVEQIKNAKGLSIDFNINTKTFSDYNKKLNELVGSLKGIEKITEDLAKASLLLAKLKAAEATAAEKVAKQTLAETKAKEAQVRASERQAAASNKATAAAEKAASKKAEEVRPYKQLVLAFTEAARKAQDLSVQYGTMDKRSQEAAKKANALNNELKKIDATIGNHQRNVGNYGSALDNVGGKIKGLITNFLGLIGVVGVGSIFSSSIDEFVEMDKNVRLLQNTLRNIGIPEAFGRIEKSANKLADQFKFLDNDEILKVFNQLVVYGKLTEDQINDLIPVIVDFATASGKDLSSATSDILKALEGNSRALKEYGINMKDAKSVTEGFSLIMTELKPRVEGVGQAFSDSAAGGLATAKQEFKNLKEEIGEGLLPVLVSLLSGLNNIGKGLVYLGKQTKTVLQDIFDLTTQGDFGVLIGKGEGQIKRMEETQKRIEKTAAKNIADQELAAGSAGEAIANLNQNLIEQQNIIDRAKRPGSIFNEKDIAEANRSLRVTRLALEEIFKIQANGDNILGIGDPNKEKDKKEKQGRDLLEADRKARFEIQKSSIELDKEFDLIRANDEKRSFEDRVSNIINYGADSQRLIEAQAKFELGNADLTKTEREKIENDKNNSLIRLVTELNDKLKKIARDNFETGTNKLPIDSKIPKELQKILDDFSKAQKKAIDDAAANAKKLKEAFKAAFESLATELSGLFFDVFQNAIEREKNAVQDQIDLLELQKQKDIEVANQTITNAQDRADAIAVIEARAAAKRQQLELRQRQLDQQKARFEKANAVTRIIQETGIAIMSSFKTDPTGILALVIGALGAAQLVRVLAQPIPKYAEGTDYHPGGKAVVGDGGRSEGVVMPDGSVYRTPSTSTVVDLPEGAKVFPDYSKMMMNATMTKVPVFNIKTVDNTSATMEKVGRNIVRAVKSIPQPHLTTDGAWSKAMKTGSNFRTYLNKNL